jgi:hypothetical protein
MKSLLVLSMLTLAGQVFAHADHPPRVADCAKQECTKKEIESAVPLTLQFLTDSGRLDKMWLSKKITKVEKQKFEKSEDWVVTVNNPQEKDAAKKNLYIFITTSGIFGGLNFTGK